MAADGGISWMALEIGSDNTITFRGAIVRVNGAWRLPFDLPHYRPGCSLQVVRTTPLLSLRGGSRWQTFLNGDRLYPDGRLDMSVAPLMAQDG